MKLSSSFTATKFLKKKEENIKSSYTIALAGNPNVGKSTIFNALTGMHQHTGNWAGKTVANAKGSFTYHNIEFHLVDLPGTYSLMSHSAEEEIARDYICFAKPDCTIVVLDATCLERNLNLVFQILEITNHVIVCVNLLDEAEKKGIHIDFKKLSELLGVPVVGTKAHKKKTLHKLLNTMEDICTNKCCLSNFSITYAPIVEKAISLLTFCIPLGDKTLSRWVSLKLLDGNETLLHSMETNWNINLHTQNRRTLRLRHIPSPIYLHAPKKIELSKLKASIHSLPKQLKKVKELLNKNHLQQDILKDSIVSSLMNKAEDICQQVVSVSNSSYQNRDRKIDKVLTSKTWGIPIMLCFLGLIFWLTISFANYPSQLLSQFFGYCETHLLQFFEAIHAPDWITNIFVLGMFKTLGWVISVMLPPMAIFFPLFTILEDLGYLPRIAFNLDNFFRKACTTGKQALTMCMGMTKWVTF